MIESDHAAIRVEIEWEWGNGTKEEKEKVSEQTEMGSVWQTDEWEGV